MRFRLSIDFKMLSKSLDEGPSHGDERVTSKYAWFPVVINGEWRWFEEVSVRQRYFDFVDSSIKEFRERGCPTRDHWYNVEFVDTITTQRPPAAKGSSPEKKSKKGY